MAQRVLVTGGAGYLGSIMVPMLLDRGYEVVVLDNFMYGQKTLAGLLWAGRLPGDPRRLPRLGYGRPGLAEVDVIIPLAALVERGLPAGPDGGPIHQSPGDRASGEAATLRGSGSSIPPPTAATASASRASSAPKKRPCAPSASTARPRSRRSGRRWRRATRSTFRLATVFGMSPRMRIDLLVNDFVYRAVTDRTVVVFEGHFKRNYLHVRDVARAFLHALDHFDRMQGGPYNVGLSDANLSKLELCERSSSTCPASSTWRRPSARTPTSATTSSPTPRSKAPASSRPTAIDDGIRELHQGLRDPPQRCATATSGNG